MDLLDYFGHKVYQYDFDYKAKLHSIEVGEFQSGIYVIRLSSSDGQQMQTVKFIKV